VSPWVLQENANYLGFVPVMDVRRSRFDVVTFNVGPRASDRPEQVCKTAHKYLALSSGTSPPERHQQPRRPFMGGGTKGRLPSEHCAGHFTSLAVLFHYLEVSVLRLPVYSGQKANAAHPDRELGYRALRLGCFVFKLLRGLAQIAFARRRGSCPSAREMSCIRLLFSRNPPAS
jgi:hypothetical protein